MSIIKVADYLPKVVQSLSNKAIGLSTGLPHLDKKICGLSPAELVILAGRPGLGKTSLAIGVGLHISRTGNVLIFSLEMSATVLIERMLVNLSRVDYRRLKAGALSKNEKSRLEAAQEELSKRKLFINDSALVTPADIDKQIQLLNVNPEDTISCVLIDYLQLMALSHPAENRNQELSVICRHLRATGKKYNIPIVLLSQLNRAVEFRENKRPQLSDLRDSGSIEQDADIVLLLYRPGYYKQMRSPNAIDDGAAEIIVAKNRNGPTGVVNCMWDSHCMAFSEGVPLGEF